MTLSSPRSWGCFQGGPAVYLLRGVFPTLVGVFLFYHTVRARRLSLPHARGGVSQDQIRPKYNRKSSPRSWGCFFSEGEDGIEFTVFPTLVGVFLS